MWRNTKRTRRRNEKGRRRGDEIRVRGIVKGRRDEGKK
jgi:hypothetical protein